MNGSSRAYLEQTLGISPGDLAWSIADIKWTMHIQIGDSQRKIRPLCLVFLGRSNETCTTNAFAELYSEIFSLHLGI